MPLSDLNKHIIVAQIDRRAEESGPVAGNRSHSYVRAFLGWCADRGYISGVPIAGMKRPHREVSRDHVVSNADLYRVWKAAGKHGGAYGAIIKLCILTAQRKGEVASMRWSQLNFDRKTWLLTSSELKSGISDHLVPLSAAALDIIHVMPRMQGEYVFGLATGGSRPFSGWSKSKVKLDEVARTEEPFTVHDLRRTTASRLAELGTPAEVIERILGHRTGKISGIAAVYNRHAYTDEMRIALESLSEPLL